MPRLITKDEIVRSTAERWKRQYWRESHWTETMMGSSKDIYRKLDELGQEINAEQIAEIIGNKSWTELQCHQCGKDVKAVVEVGQEPDYESHTALLCIDCIRKDFQVLKGYHAKTKEN